MPWLIAAVILGGLYLYGRAADAAGSTVSPPGPSGPTGLMAAITDPNTLRQYQVIMATGISNTEPQGAFGLHVTDYNAGDVDGTATNPRWIAALSALQRDFNSQLAQGAIKTDALPAGFPLHLRTDGVLDYATAIVITNG